jgi:hypothetical protein
MTQIPCQEPIPVAPSGHQRDEQLDSASQPLPRGLLSLKGDGGEDVGVTRSVSFRRGMSLQ